MTDLETSLRRTTIPVRMHNGLLLYIEHGIRPGHFLTAVLANDLRGAVERADDDNITLLPIYIRWLYNHAPGPCWGSPERVDAWIESHGGKEPR